MKKLIIDFPEYRGLVNNLCRQIAVSNWRPDYVVGIIRGGCLPAVMISHYFKVPCWMLNVSLRDHKETESNLWMSTDAFGAVPSELQDNYSSRWDPTLRKNILIVDDINDSGATINWIMKDWTDSCFPKEQSVWNTVWNNNVRFAVVVDNFSSECKVKMDYASMDVNRAEEKDLWIEFPYEAWWV